MKQQTKAAAPNPGPGHFPVGRVESEVSRARGRPSNALIFTQPSPAINLPAHRMRLSPSQSLKLPFKQTNGLQNLLFIIVDNIQNFMKLFNRPTLKILLMPVNGDCRTVYFFIFKK